MLYIKTDYLIKLNNIQTIIDDNYKTLDSDKKYNKNYWLEYTLYTSVYLYNANHLSKKQESSFKGTGHP